MRRGESETSGTRYHAQESLLMISYVCDDDDDDDDDDND